MSKIAKSLTDLIGNTPLLELSNYNKANGLEGKVIAKLEYFNPGGSVKDRIAKKMIEEAFIPLVKKGSLSLYHHPGKWKAMDTYKEVEEINELWQKDPFWKVWSD